MFVYQEEIIPVGERVICKYQDAYYDPVNKCWTNKNKTITY